MKHQSSMGLICAAIVSVAVFSSTSYASNSEISSVYASVKPLGLDSWISLSLMNLGGASIGQLPEFMARSEFKISVRASGGSWIGVSFKDSRGSVFDVPPQQRSGRSTVFYWTLPTSFADGPIQVTVALWEDYDSSSNRMVGELARYNWAYVASKTGGSGW